MSRRRADPGTAGAADRAGGPAEPARHIGAAVPRRRDHPVTRSLVRALREQVAAVMPGPAGR
ncbi:hypothetical protein ACFUCQ_36590 [Streptomyces sp. NPDC057197]|uniref:hypothetical protein n=1 Tax=Streptomyces sp. NPDC057197 TaxID=3346045 RepID=UPI00363885C9